MNGRSSAGQIRRRFVRVQGRGVHYLRAGDGPPVVLLHPGVSSARSLLPLLQQLASDHTVFAFDHPGYGDSDPLPRRKVRVDDIADALAATLAALKMPRCPVYGNHTGAAVALELARRYPNRVSAVIMDGPTAFQRREARYFVGADYLPPFVVEDDGSHLFATWVKARDTLTWFPWCERAAKNRRYAPFPTPEGLHQRLIDRLRAGDGYRAVYGAAFQYDTHSAVRALAVPAVFMAHGDDLILAHLTRLPKLKTNQQVLRFPAQTKDYLNEIARVLRRYRTKTKAPDDARLRPTPGAINRRYVDTSLGQILVRSAGESRKTRSLLLLHEGRSSSRAFESLMRALCRRRPVYAPDLPDNGASDPLRKSRPDIKDYADAVMMVVEALRLGPCDVYAVGAGASVALALSARTAFSKSRMLFESPDFYTPAFARNLARNWAPPIAPEWEGAHLNRLWLMLRDEYAFWPWFDKSAAAACALDTPKDWQELHGRVADILRSLPTYHRLTLAALRFEWPQPLRRMPKHTVTLATVTGDPRRSHAKAAAARLSSPMTVEELPSATDSKTRKIVRLLDRRP